MTRIAKKEEKDLYVAYKLGVDIDENTIIYSKPKLVKGMVIDSNGTVSYEDFGKTFHYDKRIVFEYNKDTKFIDEYSIIWLNKKPLENSTNANYDVVYKSEVVDGLFTIYINSISNDTSKLYVSYDDENIIGVQIDLDYENLEAVIRNDMYFPIDNNTKIWLQRPNNINDNSNRIVYTNRNDKEDISIIKFEYYEE